MANQLYIPDSNPCRFYEYSPIEFDQYLTRWFDSYRFTEQLLPWQEPSRYSQKWQTSDVVRFQLHSDFSPLQIDLINQYGQSVATFVADLSLPNKYIAGLYAYQFTISLASIPPGCYHARLSNGNLTELHMISEPWSVAETWEDTKLIEYRNSKFFGDVVFETGITFGLRVETSFGALEPGALFTSYNDQKYNPYTLSARPYRVWPLTIGGTYGVPDWVMDKFNIIWCHNSVLVDGRPFGRNEESKIAYKDIEYYAMRGATIELLEGINRGSKIVNPDVNTTKKLLVVYNINTRLFGDLSENASSNLVPITDTE